MVSVELDADDAKSLGAALTRAQELDAHELSYRACVNRNIHFVPAATTKNSNVTIYPGFSHTYYNVEFQTM